ncbi:PB1 domain-containing protein [Artemisia annua]|uniref:PB1 domain-containing protein n=1 Tax=Artemisia annua TaxID=35608 RepID=A0A2U1KLH7_ARTAN|nr:PB1 domain-containing protein [Artemisia annua]
MLIMLLNSYGLKAETVLESLSLTLKACLPSFEFASGEIFGDELQVFYVQNSLGRGTGFFKVLEGNRISRPSKPYIETMKRKCSDSNQQEEPIINLYVKKKNKYDEDLAVVACYKEKSTLFLLSTSSSELENLVERINQDFDINQGTYNLECEVSEGLWMRLADNESFRIFILDWKEAKKTYIELRVTSDYKDTNVNVGKNRI